MFKAIIETDNISDYLELNGATRKVSEKEQIKVNVCPYCGSENLEKLNPVTGTNNGSFEIVANDGSKIQSQSVTIVCKNCGCIHEVNKNHYKLSNEFKKEE